MTPTPARPPFPPSQLRHGGLVFRLRPRPCACGCERVVMTTAPRAFAPECRDKRVDKRAKGSRVA